MVHQNQNVHCLKPPGDDIVRAVHFHNKVNFAILDQAGTLLTSSMQLRVRLQLRVRQLPYPDNIHTRVFIQTFSYTMDITKMQQTRSVSKYLAIHLYANSAHGQPTDGQYQCKLRMIPLSIFGNVEL